MTPASSLAAAQAAVVTPDQTNYLLRPQDALEISVWKEPDLAEQMGMRPHGKIS
jgi:protein involved in polysaccharide export with SLBB domain